MKLISTRDPNQHPVSYSEAILQGLASDGGLFVPLTYPRLDEATLQNLTGKPYIELFLAIKKLFVDNIDNSMQTELARQAFTPEKFPNAPAGNLVPVREIVPGLYIQNLSLGPTAAFKDMALQQLAQEMNYVLTQRHKRLRLLGATSGDTGSAAEAAVKGLPNMQLFMLSPEQGMSSFQKAQMGALSGENIFNISIRGSFDDCQTIVKQIKRDVEFDDIGAVNSINWGRVASQIPYYVSGYLQVAGDNIGSPVDFVVPTGNFGNMLAGYIARRMGVPIRRLIVATNENDVLHTLVQTGQYVAKQIQNTSAPSMDISKASNFERLLYDLLDRNPERVATYMTHVETTGRVNFQDVDLPPDALKQQGVDSGRSTHQDRIQNIAWVRGASGQIIDPHTAAAVHIARQKQTPDVPIICMETALPVKFEPTIKEALGFVPQREARFKAVETKGVGGFTRLAPDIKAVKDFIREHSKASPNASQNLTP